ncbi:oxygenase MpaB family protein [Streptacidiphilus monticola]|uniref:Oxygenase MpaB family protein n=1 Tax=Streptacidiphilus monticola TaxID=2161674 RepID=A0ABW1FZN4_9ACTN
MALAAALLKRHLDSLVHGGDLHLERYAEPAGDPGLFGPDSVAWRVNGDLPGMLCGGIAALLLQSLHPLAMAGVDQFSDYRERPVGRLNTTAAFVATTTYGSTRAAEAMIERVRTVHRAVHGTAPDGRPYRADDPDLLTWVHVAEMVCFLRGYEVFGPGRGALSAADRDRYFTESALIARKLGAARVPVTARQAGAYLQATRPSLRLTPAARDAARFLRDFGRTPAERVGARLLFAGAVTLLPPWAARELGLRQHLLARPPARLLGGALRAAVQPSPILAAAHGRCLAGTDPGGTEGRGRVSARR